MIFIYSHGFVFFILNVMYVKVVDFTFGIQSFLNHYFSVLGKID